MLETVQRIIILMVIMNVILQITDLERYGKYLRFVTGCLLAVYILSPIAAFLSGEQVPEYMKEWVGGSESNTNTQGGGEDLLPFYVQSAESRLLSVLQKANYPVVGVRVAVVMEQELAEVSEVTVLLRESGTEEDVKKYLCEFYNIGVEHIHITVVEDENG